MDQASAPRIIVGIDDSPSGLAALRWAVGRARADQVQLVAVRSWGLGLPRHGGRRHRRAAHPRVVLFFSGAEQRKASAQVVRYAFQAATGSLPRDITVTVRTPEGDPGPALTGTATRAGDLIVVGHEHVPVWRRAHRGGVSRYCRSHAGCPVVVVPTEGSRHDKRTDVRAGSAAVPARDAGHPAE